MKAHVTGNGKKKVLIVHGWGESSGTYRSLTCDLEGSCQFCLVDLPGFGNAPPPCKGEPILEIYKSEIIEMINENDFELIVGHSLGGAVLIRALNDPNLNYNNHVVLANPAYCGIRKFKPLAYFWRINSIFLDIQKRIPFRIVKPVLKIAGRNSVKDPKMLNDKLLEDSHRADPYTAARLGYELVFDEFVWETHRKLKSVTVFLSEYDTIVSNKNILKLEKDICDCRLVVFEGVGHMSVAEDYNKFKNEIEKVLLL